MECYKRDQLHINMQLIPRGIAGINDEPIKTFQS